MRNKAGYLLSALIYLALCGCAAAVGPKSAADPATAYAVTDSQGVIIKLQRKPQRVLSVNIAADEILIGLLPPTRIVALSYLAEESGISHIIEEAKKVPVKVRAQTEPIVALQPDLVMVPDWLPAEFPLALRDAGLTVYIFKTAGSIDDVRRNIREFAHVMGESAQGEELVAKMDAELHALTAKLKRIPDAERVTVARVSNMGGSGGAGTSFDDICRHAGVRNAGALAGLDKTGNLTQEQLVQIDPDIFLLPTWDFSNKTDMEKIRSEIQGSPAMQTIKAVRNGRLVQVPDRDLFCTSQFIVQAVRGVAMAAYPQLFVE
ncbi:MAG: ABC transporter substrate-binding protein [Negativicutes bacterium]